MNTTIDNIKNRVSLRRYKDTPITNEHKQLLFDSAILAPTAGNQMLYTMIDITEQDIKDKLAVSCDNQGFISKAPMVVIFVANQQRWFDYYEYNDVATYCTKSDNLVFESPKEGDLFLACEDAMCAAQTMVLAAESIGIGSCYIGDILENYEYIKELLNLPDWTFPIAMLTLGYYPENYNRVHRKRFDKKYIVHTNKYHKLSKDEINDMYQEAEGKYNPNNKYGAKNYAQQFYSRKTGATFSKEMARSVKEALKNWKGHIIE